MGEENTNVSILMNFQGCKSMFICILFRSRAIFTRDPPLLIQSEEMQIWQKHGGFRGGGVPGDVGRRRVLPGGERGRVGAGVDELLVRSEFTPRPSQIGARSLRPEIPARGRNFRPTGSSGP